MHSYKHLFWIVLILVLLAFGTTLSSQTEGNIATEQRDLVQRLQAIQDGLKGAGRTSWTQIAIDAQQGAVLSTRNLSEGPFSVTSEPGTCTLRIQDQSAPAGPFALHLSEVKSVQVQSMPDLENSLLARNRQNFRVRVPPPVPYVIALDPPTSVYNLTFKSEGDAKGVANAIIHAVEMCHGADRLEVARDGSPGIQAEGVAPTSNLTGGAVASVNSPNGIPSSGDDGSVESAESKNANNPTLAQTLDFIRDKLTQEQIIDWASSCGDLGLVHWQTTDFATTGCKVQMQIGTWQKLGKQDVLVRTISFDLSDIDRNRVTVLPPPQMANCTARHPWFFLSLHTRGGLKTIVQPTSSDSRQDEINRKEVDFQVEDKEIAQRLQRAFIHAVGLCTANQPKEAF